MHLTLSPQAKILECDSDGNILAGSLPFSVRAELFKWNYRILPTEGTSRYPGVGGKLVDPMLGGFFPAGTGRGIAFSLIDAPKGVTISPIGLITVAANAALEDEHSITVRAEYQGEAYTAVLFIQVRKRVGEARYLGTIDTLPQGSEVTILKGPVMGTVRALQGNYVFAVASGTVGARVWKMGWVYQWTGVAWEERNPVNHTDLYIRCYKDGFDVPELKQDMAWFGAVFARILVAQQAFIEELEAQIITLKRGGLIQSENFKEGQSGFRIKHDGDTEFNDGKFRGEIHADKGTFREGIFTNVIVKGDSSFQGISIEAGPLQVKPEGSTYNLSWNSGASTQTILQGIANTIGKDLPFSVNTKSGTFQGKNVVGLYGSRIDYQLPPSIGGMTYIFALTILLDDDTMPAFVNTIPSTLSVAIEYGDITFKLINLPIRDPRINGVVWKDGNILKISNG
jgi:hypothetical protein